MPVSCTAGFRRPPLLLFAHRALLLALALASAAVAAGAQAPTLTSFRISPETTQPGARVLVRLQFNRIGQAMPILTSNNPAVFNPGGGWSTGGSSMINRRITLGSRAGCADVTAHWGRRRLTDRVCAEAPAPPPVALCNSFSLSSPANGAQFTTRRVTLRWNACANATNYRVMMRANSNQSPSAVAQTNRTSATFDVPQSFGDDPIWYVQASRGGANRNSQDARLLRFAPPPPPPNPRLEWDSLITSTNFPALSSWPANFRQAVEGQHSIQSIVESRVVVRGDGQRCSACHFNNGPRLYRPNVAQNSASATILSNTTVPRSFQQQGSWSNLFADEFLANGASSQPSAGRKPSYLRQLIEKWVQDGRRR